MRCAECGQAEHRLRDLDPDAYGYLLGVYLGDGYIAPHARGVFRLRLSLDPRYPKIIDDCERAMLAVLPRVRCARQARSGPWGSWVEVGAYSKQWPCVFPQHGLGKKHLREIHLERWQVDLLAGHEAALLRGLIHSDGCRFMNTGRGGWRHPRYAFNNLSDDIRRIFCWACDQVGVRWTTLGDTVYVSRKADVARLDEFIGPKT